MSSDTVIVDYGMGNLFSVRKVIERMGFSAKVSSDPRDLKDAGRIVLPGVGHFGKAMSHLKERNLLDALNEAALVKKTPVLGICLGMQLMARHSEEGDSTGLNWFDADVVHFSVTDKSLFKVPHVGWNKVTHENEASPVLRQIESDEEFYFVHSYHVVTRNDADVLSRTHYEYPFVSAIQKDNIVGVQFHPEKSHGAGEQLIRNFLTQ